MIDAKTQSRTFGAPEVFTRTAACVAYKNMFPYLTFFRCSVTLNRVDYLKMSATQLWNDIVNRCVCDTKGGRKTWRSKWSAGAMVRYFSELHVCLFNQVPNFFPRL